MSNASNSFRGSNASDRAVDVSVIVVNFNSGPYLLPCLESVLSQDLGGRSMEVVVVENASPMDQSGFLQAAEEAGARVIVSEHNTGYAGGCNRGVRESTGQTLFLLNADVRAMPGALASLADYVERHDDVGLAEPRTFLDDALSFHIPVFAPATLRDVLEESLASRFRAATRRLTRRRQRDNLAAWQAREPHDMAGLTGAFLATRRDRFERLQGFDEEFQLYFEDFDLFRRVRSAGQRMVLVPEASAVHYAHRSTATVWEEAMAKSRDGRARYFRKHFPRLHGWMEATARRTEARANEHRPCPGPEPIELPVTSESPVLPLATSGAYLIELSFDSQFLLAAGHLTQGPEFRMAPELWNVLLPGRYFLRALDHSTLEPEASWVLTKS